jgi:hypothetical protein
MLNLRMTRSNTLFASIDNACVATLGGWPPDEPKRDGFPAWAIFSVARCTTIDTASFSMTDVTLRKAWIRYAADVLASFTQLERMNLPKGIHDDRTIVESETLPPGRGR